MDQLKDEAFFQICLLQIVGSDDYSLHAKAGCFFVDYEENSGFRWCFYLVHFGRYFPRCAAVSFEFTLYFKVDWRERQKGLPLTYWWPGLEGSLVKQVGHM